MTGDGVDARRILSHTLVVDAGVSGSGSDVRPRSWLLILHGFFGAGRNWTTVARGLARARPDWGVVLADLRLHGASQGMVPPHTLDACAGDLIALEETLDLPLPAVLGHSFGGKVALSYLARRPAGLRQVWIVDADPSASMTSLPAAGPPQGGAWEMLRVVQGLPRSFRAREDLRAALERSGFDRRTAEWMATNLEQTAAGYRWRLDLAALEALLRDALRADLWTAVENAPADVDVHVVKATRSGVISDASVSRLEAIGRATGRVLVDRVEGGHWLNADDPRALAALLAARLPAA